jgi:hypothetical protein
MECLGAPCNLKDMKAKVIISVLIIVAMIFTTLSANDKVEEEINGNGKIIVSGEVIGADSCTVYIYEVLEDGSQLFISKSTFKNFSYYKAKMRAGFDYIIIFNNGEFTKHLKIENIKVKRNKFGLKRIHLKMDVDFTNMHSAKIKQVGNFYKFYNML